MDLESLLCPITKIPFDTLIEEGQHPVILCGDGFTYANDITVRIILNNHIPKSPMTNLPLSNSNYVINWTLIRYLRSKSSAELKCELSKKPFTDPVVLSDTGVTYEREHIKEWLKTHNTSPHYAPLSNCNLIPNRTLCMMLHLCQSKSYEVMESETWYHLSLAKPNETMDLLSSEKIKDILNSDTKNDHTALSNVMTNRNHFGQSVESSWGTCNLICCDLNSVIVRGWSWKQSSFSKSLFFCSKWENCDFSRCDFSGALIVQSKFENCKFIGEEVSFVDAKIHRSTFINCVFERGSTWIPLYQPKDVHEELIRRGAFITNDCIFKTSVVQTINR